MADYSAYNEDRTKKLCRGACGKMLSVDAFRRRKHLSGNFIGSVCKPCEATSVDNYRHRTPKGRAAEIVRRTRSKSKQLGLPFDLTIEWVLERLESKNWKCALTGYPMAAFKPIGTKRGGFNWDSVSCDRIDPSGGYTQGNVRFVLNVINCFKNAGPDDRMYELAEALVQHRKE